jgi:hypothetical protein
MDDNQVQRRRVNPRLAAGAVGLLATGAIVGGVFAGSLSASAAPGSTASPGASKQSESGADRHGAASVRDGESVVTGADYDKLKAAALKAVPGGTVYRIETDADGAAYEAHMTKSDGSVVTVKFDKNLAVTATEDGMGAHK